MSLPLVLLFSMATSFGLLCEAATFSFLIRNCSSYSCCAIVDDVDDDLEVGECCWALIRCAEAEEDLIPAKEPTGFRGTDEDET